MMEIEEFVSGFFTKQRGYKSFIPEYLKVFSADDAKIVFKEIYKNENRQNRFYGIL